MASFKAEIYKHQVRRDGTYSIKIRIIHNRKKKYIDTDLVVTKNDITKGFKLKNYFFIDETEKLIKKYRDICNKNAHALKSMEVEQVFELITQVEKSDNLQIDIIEYGRNALKKEKPGTAKNIQCALNNLIAFVGRERIDINEITAKFIKEWIEWITGARAKSLYPACIRKLHNEAKREFNIEELGIIKIPLSPFSVVKLPKEPKPRDIDIPVEKIRTMFRLEDKNNLTHITSRYNIARDVFMLSFCLWGTNAKDLYECTDFKNGRITYNRAKTKDRRDDSALISIKVEPEIMPIVEKYRDKTGKRVFCFYQMYSDVGTFNAAIGKGLKQIRKIIDIDYLVFYSARHSFATIATNDVGIDKYLVHQMLNHVDEKMKITDKYIRKSWKPMDDANRKLLDFVFEK
jgi:integrase